MVSLQSRPILYLTFALSCLSSIKIFQLSAAEIELTSEQTAALIKHLDSDDEKVRLNAVEFALTFPLTKSWPHDWPLCRALIRMLKDEERRGYALKNLASRFMGDPSAVEAVAELVTDPQIPDAQRADAYFLLRGMGPLGKAEIPLVLMKLDKENFPGWLLADNGIKDHEHIAHKDIWNGLKKLIEQNRTEQCEKQLPPLKWLMRDSEEIKKDATELVNYLQYSNITKPTWLFILRLLKSWGPMAFNEEGRLSHFVNCIEHETEKEITEAVFETYVKIVDDSHIACTQLTWFLGMSNNPTVRARAAEELGVWVLIPPKSREMKEPYPAGLLPNNPLPHVRFTLLSALSNDKEPSVRLQAARALRKLPNARSEDLEQLKERESKESEPDVREEIKKTRETFEAQLNIPPPKP